eukprot:177394_1
MASLPTFSSMKEIEEALNELNFELKLILRQPNEEEAASESNVVYFTPKAYQHGKITEPGYLGMLTFKRRFYDVYPSNFTKVQLEKWLTASVVLDCPICCVQMTTVTRTVHMIRNSKLGCSSCGRCGFKICVVCVLKTALKAPCNENNRAIWTCPQCRHQAILDLPRFSTNIVRDSHLKRFSVSDQNIIKTLATKSPLYEHYLKESKTVDPYRCVNCQQLFNGKRFRCTSCRTVCYCSKQCQANDWKCGHKPWCRIWTLINDQNPC